MDSSFYDTYNKKDDQGCLIGNWVEERALQDTTGTFRHKFDDPNPRFVRSQMRPDEEDTHARTIFHTNREEAGALETANQNRYADPKVIGQDAGKGLAYKAELKGARAKMMEKGFLEAAKQVEEEEVEGAGVTLSEERFLESTTGTAFRGAVADPEEVGRRIMKTQDMEPIPAESVDVTFLRENNLRDPRRTMPPGDHLTQTRGPNGELREPSTVYSALKETGSLLHSTKAQGVNFHKSSDFSTPIEQYLKGKTKD